MRGEVRGMAILLTGLTGVVGSELAPVLQKREKVFCLVRNGRERVENGNLHGIPANQILNGDITEWYCGLDTVDWNFLRKQNITKIVHGAASVKFDDKLLTEIWTANFIGTKNMLSLAKALGVKEFHYLSTAYSLQKRNPYERSKFGAEELVQSSGIRHSIYRLGIVVGDSETGRIKSFDGFYGFCAGFHRLAENERQKRGHNDTVELPIYVDCSFVSTLNLVPINWAIKLIAELIKLPTVGKIFHITHPNPFRAQWGMEQVFKIMGIKGVRYNHYKILQPAQTSRILRIIQRVVNKELTRYRPYITEEPLFSLETTRASLNGVYVDPIPMTPEFLTNLLDFAIKKKFGKMKLSDSRG